MELKIPIEVDFDDLKSLLDDLGQLQKYKLFEGDEMVLVDVDDVADVLVKHIKAKEEQPKTGKWIDCGWSIRCSECDYSMPWAVRNYCPSCGTRMLKEGEQND